MNVGSSYLRLINWCAWQTTDYLLGRCDVSVSPDSLNAELLPHKTAASVIRDIGNLSSEQKRALAVIINDMKKLSTILGEVQ